MFDKTGPDAQRPSEISFFGRKNLRKKCTNKRVKQKSPGCTTYDRLKLPGLASNEARIHAVCVADPWKFDSLTFFLILANPIEDKPNG